ncbi:MAG TPA: OmpH family outer membrane protein [Acidobacteriaceae bacterium]|nr:OmpH family outer membrane protein [Acidobacteriaceae bacterium]
MKRSLSLVCVLASGMGVAAIAQAAPAKPADPTPASAPVAITGASKIAVINFQLAVTQTNEFRRDVEDLQKKYEPRAQALQTLNTQIEAEKKLLQDQAATISDTDKQTKLRDIDDKSKDLQRKGEDLKNDEQEAGQDTFTQVANKVGALMVDYCKQQGFGAVLDANQQNGSVLWAAEGVDITEAVINAYNTKSGIPAPASVPSAPTPTPRSSMPSASRPSATH